MLVQPFGFLGQQGPPEIVPGAIVYYDANLSTDFTDFSGNGYDGTLVGTATWTSDAYGKWWSFGSGTTADTHYVNTGYTPTSNTSLTIVCITYFPTSIGSGNYGSIVNFSGPNATNDNWARMSVTGPGASFYNILYIDDNENDPLFSYSPSVLNIPWMITLSYDDVAHETNHWVNNNKYATQPSDAVWLASQQLAVHKWPSSIAGQTKTPFLCGAILYYPGLVFTQTEVDQNMVYFKQYYNLRDDA